MVVLATRVRPAATLPGGHIVRLVVEHRWLQLPLQASPPAALPHRHRLMLFPSCMCWNLYSEGSVSPQLDGLQGVLYSWEVSVSNQMGTPLLHRAGALSEGAGTVPLLIWKAPLRARLAALLRQADRPGTT